MARRLRMQFEGATCSNRSGAAQAFEVALAEVAARYAWQVHAFVIMRNHFHLAVTTPQPNLVDGMHWLQGTFATRFNRFRIERGHLFQGRYHTVLVENAASLSRVVDCIHLNPVRTKIIPAEQIGNFRWGGAACAVLRVPQDGLRRFVTGSPLPSPF